MKTLIFTIRILTATFFLTLGCFSILMFPFLIGSKDPETATIGYGYLALLLTSTSIVYLLLRKEFSKKSVL
ncbi:hypothetical protein [Sediminibacter sp. Hel_I_10]|uniref:hypothetical protein n=1 Tax=Sediminibacter sp. Hel_I_10 TaxID=1392490 RepID=UPI000478C9A7|nr:hypothetical protein [Sediminibacter sp. Hel_I_10]